MAALSAGARRKTRNVIGKTVYDYTVGTGATIYAGSLVNINTSTGRAVAATAATGRKFLGLAEETATGNTSGTVTVRVVSDCEVLIDAAAALTKAYIGSNVAIVNDNQVSTLSNAGTAAVRVRVGRLTELEGGDAWVSLNRFSESDV